MRIEVGERMKRLEDEATEREKKRQQMLDDKLASIPSEAMVNEWARTATDDYLNDPSTLGIITTACGTANSSITASVETGTTNLLATVETGATTIQNEKAKAIKELLHAQQKAMKEIENGRVHAVTTVTNKIDNTGAY